MSQSYEVVDGHGLRIDAGEAASVYVESVPSVYESVTWATVGVPSRMLLLAAQTMSHRPHEVQVYLEDLIRPVTMSIAELSKLEKNDPSRIEVARIELEKWDVAVVWQRGLDERSRFEIGIVGRRVPTEILAHLMQQTATRAVSDASNEIAQEALEELAK